MLVLPMPVPDFQSIELTVFQVLGDGGVRSVREMLDLLAAKLLLTDGEFQELVPSGQSKFFSIRVATTETRLNIARLIGIGDLLNKRFKARR